MSAVEAFDSRRVCVPGGVQIFCCDVKDVDGRAKPGHDECALAGEVRSISASVHDKPGDDECAVAGEAS